MPESILEQDRQAFIYQASQELFAKFKIKPEKAKSSKNFLTTKIKNSITEEKFNDAINSNNPQKLQEIFAEISQQELLTIAFLNKLQFPVNTGLAISGEDNEIATKNLKQLVGANENSNQKYEGICVVKTTSDERNIGSEPQSTPFAMHSIGKVFTGVLIAEMVANKTISPDDLEKVGVELDEEVMKALPASVQAQLQKVSLHQLMTHQAALGDYLSNYMDKIEQAVKQGAPISQLENPQDFLQHASDEIKENKYSNLGMLLAGLAAQHLYNQKYHTEKSYNEILQELVIEPAHLESFSITPPKNALFNDESAAQKYICGSPAGGYWASAKDMQKFGEHLCNRMEDEKFHAAVLQYGQEFYKEETQTIQHAGDIGYEGSAWFSVHLPSRTSLVMASNDVYSRVAGEQANRVIAAEQRHKNPVTKEELDTFFSLSEGGINTVGLVEYSCKLGEEAQIKTSGSRNFYDPSQPMTAQTIVGIGSITKQFTAATLIKLWDDELTAQKLAGSVSKFFTNGLDTKLENFLPSLRNQYPQCSTLFDKIEQDENYHKITLRDLLNHTHGLGARNSEKAKELVRQANGAPLDLSSIANITEKREGEEYGKHCYGNFGYDLAAMIIETVAIEKGIANSFDDAVTKLVLQPNQLNATHTQQDHAGLYANEDSNIATGFAVDNQNPQQEFKMNGTSNTRAAGGFKSSVEDLAKFAPLFMNAEMFANEEVRQAVLDRKQGAPLSNSATELTYHLAIRTNPDGTIGHNGNDLIFNSKLSYNPQTKAVKAELQVMETLVDNITKEIFTKIYSEEAKKLENDASGNRQFWDDCKFLEYYEAAGYPPAGSPEAEAAEAAALKASPKTRELFAKYNAVREKVASLPRQSLIDDRAGVVEKITQDEIVKHRKKNSLTIAIFAPSYGSQDEMAAITQAALSLEAQGFAVDCPQDLINPPIAGCKWANSKEERARRIINILNNPEITAMWAVDGGESAIEVVNLLDEYHKNPQKVKEQIANSYLEKNQELPDNFFLPERPDLFDYSQGALPKRGIACIGFSDVSGINNFLGQKGLVSPYYADVFLSRNREKILQHLTNEDSVAKYENLKLLNAEEKSATNFTSDEPLQIYATVDGWITASCGTNFQFSLQSPSILAIESVEAGNIVGAALQHAFATGALRNVKAIVIGRTKDGQVGDDLEKYPALKEFIAKSGIAVFTTNGNLETGENTFGHGRGGISQPFANFASAGLTRQENGSYILQIEGKRSKENLDSCYEAQKNRSNQTSASSTKSNAANVSHAEGNAKLNFSVKNENITLGAESLQSLSGGTVNLSNSEIISGNYRQVHFTNGSTNQLDDHEKIVLISENEQHPFLHHTLIENYLSGTFNGAKAIIVAVPSYKEKNTIAVLKDFTDQRLPYENGENIAGHETFNLKNFSQQAWGNNLKKDLDKLAEGLVSYSATTNEDGSVNIQITILDEEKLQSLHKEAAIKQTNIFKEMLADAGKSYLPSIPLYFVEDDKLVKTYEEGLQTGNLLVTKTEEKQEQNTLSTDKPSPQPMSSHAAKLATDLKTEKTFTQ